MRSSFTPELNPAEGVWSNLRNTLGNLAACTTDELAALVRTRLKKMQYRPALGDGLIRPLGGQFFGEKNANFYGVGSDLGPTGDWTNFKESAPATDGAWQCLEWQMDATDNRITVWIDGEAKPDLTVDTRNHGGADVDFIFPEFNTVSFGWQVFQDNPTPAAFDADMDDLALSTTRVGC